MLGIVFSLFWSMVNISEFYIIVVEKNIGEYPWGPVNTNPWYYSTPQTYWIFCFTNGLVYLIASLIALNGTLKLNFKRILIGIGITSFTFLIMIISASITENLA
jgi:hypothetical protein